VDRRCCTLRSRIHAPSGKVLHKQAKRVNLRKVVTGKMANRKETLDEVRSNKDIGEVKWFRKRRPIEVTVRVEP
jgi:hypothetical protein